MTNEIATGAQARPRDDGRGKESPFVERLRVWRELFVGPPTAQVLTVPMMAHRSGVPEGTIYRWVADWLAVGLIRPSKLDGYYEIGDLGMAYWEILRRAAGGSPKTEY